MQDLHEKLLDYKPLPQPPTNKTTKLQRNVKTLPIHESISIPVSSGTSIANTQMSAEELQNEHDEDSEIKGIYLYGEVGTGKTMLMSMFYDSMPIAEKRRVHFHNFMLELVRLHWKWQTESVEVRERFPSAMDKIVHDVMSKSWLICFDEFQANDVATASLLKEFLERAFAKGAVFVMTSNRIPEDLYRGGVQRHLFGGFIELMKEKCEVWKVDVKKDFRKVLQTEHPTVDGGTNYYLSTNPAQRAEYQRRYKIFFPDNYNPIPTELKLYGRSIRIPITNPNLQTAVFDFKQLCGNESAMGSADFITIATRFNVIFLQNVPKLTLAMKDEARRFITFIDAIYENNTKLVVCAEVGADELFTGANRSSAEESDDIMLKETIGDLLGEQARAFEGLRSDVAALKRDKLPIFTAEDEIFAFKRAVSRLNELSSQVYVDRAHRGVGAEGARDDLKFLEQSEFNAESSITRKKEMDAKELPNEHQNELIHPVFRDTHARIATDDIGHEASYKGYYEMYKRYGGNGSTPTPSSSSEHKEETLPPGKKLSVYESIQSMYSEREKAKPRFRNEEHFFGFGWWETMVRKIREKK